MVTVQKKSKIIDLSGSQWDRWLFTKKIKKSTAELLNHMCPQFLYQQFNIERPVSKSYLLKSEREKSKVTKWEKERRLTSADCRSAENPRCRLRTENGRERTARSARWWRDRQAGSEVSERTVRLEQSDEPPGEAKSVTHYLRLQQVRNSLT